MFDFFSVVFSPSRIVFTRQWTHSFLRNAFATEQVSVVTVDFLLASLFLSSTEVFYS
jgi:hypothetical protein